jgi:hypothetical protein
MRGHRHTTRRACVSLQALGLAYGHEEDRRQDLTARPASKALLHRPGRMVTWHAIGCQVERARQRVRPRGNYILSSGLPGTPDAEA